LLQAGGLAVFAETDADRARRRGRRCAAAQIEWRDEAILGKDADSTLAQVRQHDDRLHRGQPDEQAIECGVVSDDPATDGFPDQRFAEQRRVKSVAGGRRFTSDYGKIAQSEKMVRRACRVERSWPANEAFAESKCSRRDSHVRASRKNISARMRKT